jgi:lipid-binding SYLF domain-containing protein
MQHRDLIFSVVPLVCLIAVGCSTAPQPGVERSELASDATDTLKQASAKDPSLSEYLQKSSGYAVFPSVNKGAAIVGGSYGRGTVYEHGVIIGYADITQATVGLQAGAQQYSELVVFESPQDVERFKAGKLTFAATRSAVALKTGSAASASYTDGVAVFVDPIDGMMFEAAVGGQQFTFQPR